MTELAPAAESTDAGREPRPSPGIALYLSGGGYRAMLFHVGSRLDQLVEAREARRQLGSALG
jgi:hypothetical protein